MGDAIAAYALDTKSGVLTDVLRIFSSVFKNGGETIAGAGTKIALSLLILHWIILVALTAFSRKHFLEALVSFVGLAVWYEAVVNIVAITDSYMNFMGSLGGHFAGSYGTGAALQNPSAIFATGLKATMTIGKTASKMSFMTGDASAIILLTLYGAFILFVCMVLGAFAVIVVVQGYIDVTIAVVLMGFAVSPATRFLAVPGIIKIIGAGFTFGTVSAIIGAGLGLLQKSSEAVPVGGDQALRFAFNMACCAVVVTLVAGVGLIASRKGVSSASAAIGR